MKLNIRWGQSETNDRGTSAYTPGYTLDVYPSDPEPGEKVGAWFWRVDLTAEISEWPEVLDCGFAATLDSGKTAATAALNKSLARREARRIAKENV